MAGVLLSIVRRLLNALSPGEFPYIHLDEVSFSGDVVDLTLTNHGGKVIDMELRCDFYASGALRGRVSGPLERTDETSFAPVLPEDSTKRFRCDLPFSERLSEITGVTEEIERVRAFLAEEYVAAADAVRDETPFPNEDGVDEEHEQAIVREVIDREEITDRWIRFPDIETGAAISARFYLLSKSVNRLTWEKELFAFEVDPKQVREKVADVASKLRREGLSTRSDLLNNVDHQVRHQVGLVAEVLPEDETIGLVFLRKYYREQMTEPLEISTLTRRGPGIDRTGRRARPKRIEDTKRLCRHIGRL